MEMGGLGVCAFHSAAVSMGRLVLKVTIGRYLAEHHVKVPTFVHLVLSLLLLLKMSSTTLTEPSLSPQWLVSSASASSRSGLLRSR